MLVTVHTEQNTYVYEQEAEGYWSEVEVQAVDADTPHIFKALLSIRNPLDHIHVTKGDILDIHGVIKQRANLFLVADAHKLAQPAF